MANATTPITRYLNKQFKDRMPAGLRIQAGIAGTFLSIRIEDPEGQLSVKMAQTIVNAAGVLFKEAGLTDDIRPVQGFSYHMEGIVANWRA